MKYFILCTLLFGAAYAAKDIEISSRNLNLTETIDKINDVLSGEIDLSQYSILGINGTNIEEFFEAFGIPLAGAGAATGVIAGISALKTALLGLLSAPLAIANGILSMVGLVLLIIFLVEGGDFLSLVGYEEVPVFRSLSSWSFSDVINNRMITDLSDMVYKAIDKYD